MNAQQLRTVLLKAIPKHHPYLVHGAPGIGKSSIIEQVSSELGADCIIFHPACDDPSHYMGYPFRSAQGEYAEHLPYGDLKQLCDTKRLTVAFFDDLGQAPGAVQAPIAQLILARRFNGFTISPHVCFIAATNGKVHHSGVSGLYDMLKTRFHSCVELKPEISAWCAWANSHNVRLEVIAFNKYRPVYICEYTPCPDMQSAPNPRTITHTSDILNYELADDITNELIKGACGESYAMEFAGFMEMFRSMVSPTEVLNNPQGANIPAELSTQIALFTACARIVTGKTLQSLITYIERGISESTISKEMLVSTITDVMQVHPDIQATKAYIDYTVKYQDIMI